MALSRRAQTIPSLRAYVVGSHCERQIELHRRLETGQWLSTTFEGDDDSIESSVLEGAFRVRDVYEDVDLEEGVAE